MFQLLTASCYGDPTEARARDKEKADRAAAAAAAFGVTHNGRPGGRWAGASDDEEVRGDAPAVETLKF